MDFVIGVVVFALGIVISIALHEYGHAGTARAFGMKVTRFFIGFGPTIFSFRRGETEYGLKSIPAGAFVKIVGMTPQDDDVKPEDEHRAMWRFPLWKRTVVMGAGSAVHFILGFALLWGVFAVVPVPDMERLDAAAPRVAAVAECTALEWQVDPQTGHDKRLYPSPVWLPGPRACSARLQATSGMMAAWTSHSACAPRATG
jgi:RIP metalloprotease RseP